MTKAELGFMGRWLTAAATSLALLAPAAAGDIALRQAKTGVPIVDVALNGEGPIPMIVDTAAGLTTVTTPLVEQLKLTRIGQLPQPVQLASGSEAIDLYSLGTVTLAGTRVAAPVTVVLDAPLKFVREARGILGMNVLAGFAVDFDQPGRRLVLHPPGTVPQVGEAWSVQPVEKRWDGFLIVTVTVDGVKARALVDTGANQTILNPKLAKKLGIVAGADGVEKGKIASAGKAASLKARIDQIAMGGTVWKDVDIQTADLGLFDALGLDKGPGLILGNDVLAQVRLFIDYKDNKIFLTRPASGALVGEDIVPAPVIP